MNPFAHSASSRAGVLIACATAAGLLLGACSNSPSSAGSGSAGSTASSGTSKSSTSGGSGNSGTGSASTVSASSVPFPIAVGNTWIYESGTATLNGTETNKVLSVTPVPGGNRVTMSNTDSIGGATNESTYIFHSDGSITYPFDQIGSQAVLVTGKLEWPPASVINSGQPTSSTIVIGLHQGTATTKKVTAHVTVKGAGTATVTVPAGTYSTTIVQMVEKYTVLGYTGFVTVRTWLANGVGPVQSEATISELGHVQVVSELKLKSFTHG
jgi:hypothetical protein